MVGGQLGTNLVIYAACLLWSISSLLSILIDCKIEKMLPDKVKEKRQLTVPV